jgi:hypothetical protein
MPSKVADSNPIRWKFERMVQPDANPTVIELLSIIAGVDVTIAPLLN